MRDRDLACRKVTTEVFASPPDVVGGATVHGGVFGFCRSGESEGRFDGHGHVRVRAVVNAAVAVGGNFERAAVWVVFVDGRCCCCEGNGAI